MKKKEEKKIKKERNLLRQKYLTEIQELVNFDGIQYEISKSTEDYQLHHKTVQAKEF